MTATVAQLARYPVKGLSPERLDAVALRPGRGVGGDRALALALPGNPFDPAKPVGLSKTLFLTLARQEGLARLRTGFDDESGVLTVTDGGETLVQSTRTAEGAAALGAFFARFLPDASAGKAPRLVSAPDHSFTDVGVHGAELMRAVSMINLASLRDFENRIGRRADPLRFRANILVEGLAPWAELDWVDRDLAIGGVRFRGARLTTRCPATEVNVETAARDISVPQELKRAYGHIYLGLYLHVLDRGRLAVGAAFPPPPCTAGASPAISGRSSPAWRSPAWRGSAGSGRRWGRPPRRARNARRRGCGPPPPARRASRR